MLWLRWRGAAFLLAKNGVVMQQQERSGRLAGFVACRVHKSARLQHFLQLRLDASALHAASSMFPAFFVRDDLAAVGISWTSQALIREISCDRSDLYGSHLDTLAPPQWHLACSIAAVVGSVHSHRSVA